MLSEISQAEKDNYHMVSLVCGTQEQPGGHQEKEGKNEGGEIEGEMNHERLWTLRNKQGFRGEGGAGMGQPGDGY